ncbi:hypothetical protein [Halalkalibacter okhensis]|uniref:hypothetical protein n=1 Tax=Halalkalibacter okhensis TaxID=333138 RepID=UPI000AF24936|nr:hypothetical protein [Halalkalibacter okhensis]
MPRKVSFDDTILIKNPNYVHDEEKLQKAINFFVKELIKEYPEILYDDETKGNENE